MKRRDFIRNLSLSGLSVPFIYQNKKMAGITNKLFDCSSLAEDRILVMIKLNGGNDGLNTVIPLNMYDNLVLQRPNIVIPENLIIKVDDLIGFHPSMVGMSKLISEKKLSIIQNVGYMDQNRSHFRSSDIWNFASKSENVETGWLGRYFDYNCPGFPFESADENLVDPFAICMGLEVSSSCQGIGGNFCFSTDNPLLNLNLTVNQQSNSLSDYGHNLEYLEILYNQVNNYGQIVYDAAQKGNTISSKYDPKNQLATHLQYVARMISGGLKTKVYVLNIGGFDTHSTQVKINDSTSGTHADLLQIVSDAIEAFQDDLQLLGISKKVAGMTFSEFGRQIASNASFGTDHGDAAPLFIFGDCLSQSIIGDNPVISDTIVEQQGVQMQIDFRDVYASILRDWFEVPEAEVQKLFDHQVQFFPILRSCNNYVSELSKLGYEALFFPNPCTSNGNIKFKSEKEHVLIEIYSAEGKLIVNVLNMVLEAKTHILSVECESWSKGNYVIKITKKSGNEFVNFSKV